ncbi:hypothetical protein FQA39_LY07392 [Lamprigera yunnana]|nr:hypothetical protein FQA39_LY07392 [Lamprigera yunnana]
MATIEKLILSGLRSFGEEDTQTIKFASPLTLFLGENGCGKTTIIEALKFACSGDLPGGTRSGQGFVNDPKLSNKATIKGQVRLSIADAKGNKYLVIKSVQVQNRGATSSFKRLDSTLRKINADGTSTVISSRCIDIDNEVCEILGVSKAILNSVIFCHQEDASWPLEEPKKLKEKFDEIFGSTEYNKCADNIRKIIKEKENDVKVQDSKVAMLKLLKDTTDRKKSDLYEKQEKKGQLQEIIKEKQKGLIVCANRLLEICQLENDLAQLQEVYTKKETLKNALLIQQQNILKDITNEFKGSDQDLKMEIESFKENTEKLRNNLKQFETKNNKLDEEQKQLSSLVDKAQVKLGNLQAQKNQNEKNVLERNDVINKLSTKLSITVPYLNDDEGDISTVLSILSTNISQRDSVFEKQISECDSEETKLQKLVDISRDKIAKAEHEINLKMQQIKEIDKKNREINSCLKELDYSDEQLKSLHIKIASIDSDLKNCKESFNVNTTNAKIENEKQEIHKLESQIEDLEQEHKVLLKNNVTEAELELQKHEIVKREGEIHKLMNKHFDNLHSIFEDVPSPGFIKRGVENLKHSKTSIVEDINKKIVTKQKEATTLESKCRFQKDKLQTFQKELEEHQQKVLNVCHGKPFERECTELQQLIDSLQKDKGQLSSAKIMYEKFVTDFQKEQPCCPLCKSNFAGQQTATKEIIDNIKKKISGIPKQLHETIEKLKQKEEQYKQLLQLKPINDRIVNLSDTLIPKTTTERAEFETYYDRVGKELTEYKEQVKLPQDVVDKCNKIMGDVALIDQQQLEINSSKRKINDLEKQLVQVPSNQSRQQIEIHLQSCKLDLTNSRRNYETLQTKFKQYNDNCQQLREERSKHIEKQLQIQKAMQGKPQLQEQLAELTEKEQVLAAETTELKDSLHPLSLELKEAEALKDELKITNREKLKHAQNELNSFKKFITDIQQLQKHIENYVFVGNEAALQSISEELTKFKNKNIALEEGKREIYNNIADINKQLENEKGEFRNLTDNLLLRQKSQEENKLKEEVNVLKQQIGNHNYKTILKEKECLQSEKEEHARQKSQSQGKIDILQQEIGKIELELSSNEYKNSHSDYKKALITYMVSKNACKNLHLFLNALEKGVLKFHQERMNQINKIIAKLWRSIYRGNDCDHIKIKTEESSSTGLRRSYNYKVVQIKSDVEIEMRGRCSAGQKVLACLVIRMALSETFSKNCGILALDEPTTNLDRANIQSLSAALAKVVNARQEEKNFQLLIITHDAEFINALTRVDKVDYFWRVTRNERGNSVVTKDYNL